MDRVAVMLLLATSVAAPVGAQGPDTLRVSLEDVVRLAAERSASVELARLTVEEGEAGVTLERASLLPHLSLAASHGDRTFNTASFGLEFPTLPGQEPLFDPAGEVLGPVTSADMRARVSQTLFDWSAVQQVRLALAELDADRVGIDVARERAASLAAAAYVQAERAAGRLAARSADVALAEELLAVARDLLDGGVGVRLDVTRAESQLASMRAQLLTAEADDARAKLALLRTLNLQLDTPVRLLGAAQGDDASAGSADVEVEAALAQRPDVMALERDIAAAQANLTAVRAQRLPTLSVEAGDGITGSSYRHLLNTYEWSLRVSVPVFDGRERGAREHASRVRVSALEVQRRELAERLEYEIRDALLGVASARQLIEASQARLILAEAELEQARDRFAAGVASSADVFTASLRLNEARTADVDARAALDAARVTLATARGTVRDLR